LVSDEASPSAEIGVAQRLQNFASGGFSTEHRGHTLFNGFVHLLQNFAPLALSAPQLEQSIYRCRFHRVLIHDLSAAREIPMYAMRSS
jgi:hypothetical protein